MHQTFYIDADEEISSVIDRLNKSVSAENFFVVPKRAIFLQSIVNLKLLKREADKLGKHLVLVTQDEIGASMAKRSGLEVKHTIEGLEPTEIDEVFHTDKPGQELDFFDADAVIDQSQDKKGRLNAIGSNDYYDLNEDIKNKKHKEMPIAKSQTRKIPINGVSGSGKNVDHISTARQVHEKNEMHRLSKIPSGHAYGGNKLDPSKERILEKMFSSGKSKNQDPEKPISETSGGVRKIFVGFIILCFFVFAGVATFLFLPSAKIIVTPNILVEKMDTLINGNTEITQVDQTNMPIRIIDKEKTLSLSYVVAGTSAGTGKKAHGSVVIYNEYDSSPQTLVATTRLESSDGKIFRIVKNVIVPGTTTVGSETKPGAIEAEVVADQPGGESNLSPTSFTVPGFKGGPKYGKFYAKSTENFIGGSSEGGNSPGAVSQKDIDDAKQQTEATLKEQLSTAIGAELAVGEISLKQAEKIEIIKASAKTKVGDLTDSFEYTVTASIRALVFSENDVKSIIRQTVKDKQELKDAEWDVSKVEYGTVVADFEKNTLELKVHGEIKIIPVFDTEKIKSELLGKKDDQLGVVLKNYASIKSVNVEFQPTIVSRIPQYAWRVTVEVNNSAE